MTNYAETTGCYGPIVRPAYWSSPSGKHQPRLSLGVSLRMRGDYLSPLGKGPARAHPKLRLSASRGFVEGTIQAWAKHCWRPSKAEQVAQYLVGHEGPLHEPQPQQMGAVRRSRDNGLRGVVTGLPFIRSVGSFERIQRQSIHRSDRQRWRLPAGELSLGNVQRAGCFTRGEIREGRIEHGWMV